MKNFYILFIALFIANIARAQQWAHYGNVDNVEAMVIDAQGNKWFGTYGSGVSKFDGINWTYYNTTNGLCDIYVRSLATDAHGNLWVGTYNGVSKFDGTNWTTYTTADGLADNNVTAIAKDAQGNIWFGTFYGGVSKFDGTNWTTFTMVNGLADNCVPAMAVDFQGNMWFGTWGGGVSKFDGVNWTTYTMRDGLGRNIVATVSIDDQGYIWCGSGMALEPLSRFDGLNWTNYLIPNADIDAGSQTIVSDIQGNKWIGTGGAAYKFDGINWTNLRTDHINAIAIDSNGNKWFATEFNGVWELSDGGAGPVRNACIINGTIFYDINENGIQDNGEPSLTGKMVEVINDSKFYTTQINGNFNFCRDSGTYQIKCIPLNYWQFTTDSIITINVTDTSTYITNVNFGIKMHPSISDLSVDIAESPARVGFTIRNWITYKNEATVTQNGYVMVKIDTLTSFVSSVPSPDSLNGNILVWDYSNLIPFEQRQIQIYLLMPDFSHLGEMLTTTAIIYPIEGDAVPANNYDTLMQVLTGSVDPNDKSVDKGKGNEGYTLFGEELAYTIRFQNTGTDTAFIVQIRDTIDRHLDIATMRIVSSSHHVRLDVKENNIATFIFENILLPDSTTNETNSNGFVKFGIKPKSGLAENTVVNNKAYIYFDYNPPVITNLVLNTFVSAIPTSGGIDGHSASNKPNVIIYPNPATDEITIIKSDASSNNYLVSIKNIQGQLLMQQLIVKEKTEIDINSLSKGIYILELCGDNSTEVAKIIKE